MSLRARLALAVGLLVAVAVAISGALTVVNAERELRAEVDDFLRARVGQFGPIAVLGDGAGDHDGDGRGGAVPFRRDRFDQPDAVTQIIDAAGDVVRSGEIGLPVDDRDRAIAAGDARAALRTVSVDGQRYRQITAPVLGGGAFMIARDLSELDAVLAGLTRRTIVLGVVGAGLAALAAWILASRISRPVARLTAAAAHVADTQDLSAVIAVDRRDEVGRLAGSFNTMLAALDTSRRQQQRLVMDASHELRTPLTSLRTNVDLLRRAEQSGEVEPSMRREILGDVAGEASTRPTALVTELVELATSARRPDEPAEVVDLGEVVTAVVERSRRRTGRTIDLEIRGGASAVVGHGALLERAVSNLVDNAVKFSEAATSVTVVVDGSDVRVADRGPGIDAEDLPHVFDRFYRAVATRSTPGSGLGLAIVADVVAGHGGTVFAEGRTDGPGALVGFRLPPAPSAPVPPSPPRWIPAED